MLADPEKKGFRPVSREEARAAGQSLYLGKPCPHGHRGWRHTASANCYWCRHHRRGTRHLQQVVDAGQVNGAARRRAEDLLEDLRIQRMA